MDGTGIEGVAWEDLQVLLAGLRTGSLNQVARTLGVSVSTASRRLARLEGALDRPLFDRVPEGLLPTALARSLEPHALMIEGQMADIERLALATRGPPRGTVRLALPDGIASKLLVPRLGAFFAQYPDVDLELLIGHAVVDLVRREADVALRFVPPTAPDLVRKALGPIPMGLYGRAALRGRPLDELRWVMFIDPEARLLETQWVQQHVRPAHTLCCSSWNTLFAAVEQGIGPALLSPLVAEAAGLVPLGAGLPLPPARTLWLVHHQALRHVPTIAALRGWLSTLGAEILAG